MKQVHSNTRLLNKLLEQEWLDCEGEGLHSNAHHIGVECR